MVAVVLYRANSQGKIYRVATPEDEAIFCQATTALQKKRDQLALEWGVDPVPDEPLTRVPITFGVINVWVYGMNDWGSLFNTRQKLALITFAEKVRQVHELMLQEGIEQDFATAVATYMGILFDWLADKMSTLTRWNVKRELVSGTYSRQAIPMAWDYFEVNPFSGVTSSWNAALGMMLNVLKHCSQVAAFHLPAPTITQATATQLPYADNYFDAILTDPPYYDNVPYSYLSDFFYVWLKRTVGHLHPDLFSTPLTPKANEIVAYTKDGGVEGGKRFFETNLKRAFQEMYRVLKPEGIAIIVYAHKSTAGWETVINALLDSNLVVTGAWPLNTEMEARMRAQESATLASSIYIVARKMVRQPTGFYNEVRDELRRYLDSKLHRLWEEGIGGADFFIAAIGSAIEVFGRYEQVLDYEGNIVRADRLLDEVRTIATDYAVRQILHNGFASEISDLTRFYVLWRWNYGEARVPFDEARKLAQSCGLDLTREWGRGGFIRKVKEFVQVLGPQLRKLEGLENSHELVDVLHYVLLLWEKSQRTELVQALATSGYGQSEAFYRVAQAISETLPNESKEKKLLDGFLAGRERVREDVGRIAQQRGLWEE
jgi:putative DNA methylase